MSATKIHDASLAALDAADRALDETAPSRASLCPERRDATRLLELGQALLTEAIDPDIGSSFARRLAAIACSLADNFPGNIFWDLDALAATLLEQRAIPAIEAMAGQVIALGELFGHKTAIRFRYVHDFLYGFDWARWVRDDPASRAAVGPFHPVFLANLDRRGHELLALIAADDETYHALSDDETHRNPFTFSREPADERRLHEALAADDLIPLRAWTRDGTRSWERRFTYLRRLAAQRLGIPVRDA